VRTQLAVLLVLLADLEVHSPTACSLGAAHHNHHGRGGGPGCAHLAVLNPLHTQIERQRLESIAGVWVGGARCERFCALRRSFFHGPAKV
jgi:hypothetical protein